MNINQLHELLLQSLEHERGGIKVYETALQCALNPDLRNEWSRYLNETRNHERALLEACAALSIDPEEETPGRRIVRRLGTFLLETMQSALQSGHLEAAQLVACECVVLAETKDHLDWELIGRCAERLDGNEAALLKRAYDEIEDQEDEHLYHSRGWCRELWMASLGIPSVLPPPEEHLHVVTPRVVHQHHVAQRLG